MNASKDPGFDLTGHPGRSYLEAKAIDFIGMGRGYPGVPSHIVKDLVRDGLLTCEMAEKRDVLGAYTFPRYSLPEQVRIQWELYWCERAPEEE